MMLKISFPSPRREENFFFMVIKNWSAGRDLYANREPEKRCIETKRFYSMVNNSLRAELFLQEFRLEQNGIGRAFRWN